MICSNCGEQISSGAKYSHVCTPKDEKDSLSDAKLGSEERIQLSEQDEDLIKALAEDLPTNCTVCGREDETIRFVVYPYVVSFIILTFRRQFAGVWCARHRFLWQLFASAITASLGWLGIPFGFIWTPIALFKLARGGVQSPELNAHLLERIAQKKALLGRYASAAKVMEARANYIDDAEALRELHQLRSKSLVTGERKASRMMVSSFLIVWLGAALIGSLIGVLDYWITILISLVLSPSEFLIITIISWVPFVMLLFLGSICLVWLISWALKRCCARNMAAGIFLGISASILAIYSILQGAAMGEYLYLLLNSAGVIPAVEMVSIGIMVLFAGGLYQLEYMLTSGLVISQIYLILLGIAAVFYFGITSLTAKDKILWQRKIQPA